MRVEADAGDVEEEVAGDLAHVDAPPGRAERVAQRHRRVGAECRARGRARCRIPAGTIASAASPNASTLPTSFTVPSPPHAQTTSAPPCEHLGGEHARMPRVFREPHVCLDAGLGEHRSRQVRAARALVGPAEQPRDRVDDDADAHGRRQPAMRRSMRGVTNHRRCPGPLTGSASKSMRQIAPFLNSIARLGADQPRGELSQVGLVAHARDVRAPGVLRQVGEERRVGAARARATAMACTGGCGDRPAASTSAVCFARVSGLVRMTSNVIASAFSAAASLRSRATPRGTSGRLRVVGPCGAAFGGKAVANQVERQRAHALSVRTWTRARSRRRAPERP